MANIKSQIKRNRQNERRRDAQQGRALRAQDPRQARPRGASTPAPTTPGDRSAPRRSASARRGEGLIHKNQAARRTSRLMKRAKPRRVASAPRAAQPRRPRPIGPRPRRDSTGAASRATSTSITASSGIAARALEVEVGLARARRTPRGCRRCRSARAWSSALRAGNSLIRPPSAATASARGCAPTGRRGGAAAGSSRVSVPITCSGCIGLRLPRARRGEQPVQHLERAGDVARLDRVRELVRRARARLAEVRLDVVDVEASRRRRRPPRARSTSAATRPASSPRCGRHELRRVGAQLQIPASREVLREHVARLLGCRRRTLTAFAAFSVFVERRRQTCPRRRRARARSCRAGRRGTGRAARRRPRSRFPTSRTTTTRRAVMNGGLCAAFSDRGDDRRSRPSAPLGASLSAVAGAARPGTRDSSSASVRSSSPSSSSTSSLERLARAATGIVALDADTRPRPSRVTARSVALERRASPRPSGTPSPIPATSCTRTIRHPCATPYATAASDASRRSSIVEVEQLAEEALVRRRQQQRVAERGERVALAQQHRALRRASCRGRARRRARSARARARRPRRARPGRAGTRCTSPTRSS